MLINDADADDHNNNNNNNEKALGGDANTARWRSQIFSLRSRPHSPGCGTAKILTAGDGHYLYLQTQFGEDRYMQFRVIVVTVPQTHTETGSITIHCAAASAHCNNN